MSLGKLENSEKTLIVFFPHHDGLDFLICGYSPLW
jgi:hypothetical protein